jgi:hypothetical protein
MAVRQAFFKFEAHQTKRPLLSAEGCHTQGSIALLEHITKFFSRADNPSEDINSRLFLMNKKGFHRGL